jgi:hypothetical protein
MSSLNGHCVWAGNIEDVISMSIRENGKSLVNLIRNDGEGGPNGAVKEEPYRPSCQARRHA